MKITYPAYYSKFQCIAGACPDSCCKEWEVDVDDTAAAFYRGLEGPLGDRLRQVLKDTDEAASRQNWATMPCAGPVSSSPGSVMTTAISWSGVWNCPAPRQRG